MKNYTDNDVINAVKSSTSVRQVLSKLGLKEAGGNYASINKKIIVLALDTSHFTGSAWNKGRTIGFRRPIEDYLSNKYTINSYRLRNRLIKEGLFVHKCYECGLTQWRGNLIPIELEHINGNHLDNSLNNLTLLCPNCHALTSTYRGKNISTYKLSNI